MEHNYWEERLQAYLDKELDPADHIAVKNHIDACSECCAQLGYFECMKKRLVQHGATIEIPDSVARRITTSFEKKRRRTWRRFMQPSFGLALAAVLVAGVLLSDQLRERSYTFSAATLEGIINCVDCDIAALSGCTEGDFCKDGHHIGLRTADGKVYRIAMDETGFELKQRMGSLVGKRVEISGDLLPQERLIRVAQLNETVVQKALF